jgi:hypothetical protein
MRRGLVQLITNFILGAALGIVGSLGTQASQALPGPVRSALDQMHPGWRVGAVGQHVRAAVGARLGPTPNIIVGDFDGNGHADVAVLIEYPNVEPGKAFTHVIEVIAFLNTARGYGLIGLMPGSPGPNPDVYLTLQKRGTQGFDFEANRKFVYPHDSIGE